MMQNENQKIGLRRSSVMCDLVISGYRTTVHTKCCSSPVKSAL